VEESIEFVVPARGEYLGLVRMLASSLAADRREIDDERLDDLRLAVSEACALVVESGPGADRQLVVSCVEYPTELVIDVHDGRSIDLGARQLERGMPAPERLDEADNLSLELIRALVDEVSVVDREGIETLRLRIACPPAPGL
jgi:anti-sigma regulatory factor (Ser/Thr protein kinase)